MNLNSPNTAGQAWLSSRSRGRESAPSASATRQRRLASVGTPPDRPQAFTRVDLLVCLLVVMLLGALTLPGLATLHHDSSHAACINNLRQLGRAHHIWGQDYDAAQPIRVSSASGGTRGHPLAQNLWLHFSWVSNYLASPRVLVCPADQQKKAAPDFGSLIASAYRNSSISYFLGVDAGYVSFSGTYIQFVPEHILSGDRHIQIDNYAACSVGLTSVANVSTRPLTHPFWTNNVHGTWGSLLLFDGQVRTSSNASVTNYTSRGEDNGNLHMLIP